MGRDGRDSVGTEFAEDNHWLINATRVEQDGWRLWELGVQRISSQEMLVTVVYRGSPARRCWWLWCTGDLQEMLVKFIGPEIWCLLNADCIKKAQHNTGKEVQSRIVWRSPCISGVPLLWEATEDENRKATWVSSKGSYMGDQQLLEILFCAIVNFKSWKDTITPTIYKSHYVEEH